MDGNESGKGATNLDQQLIIHYNPLNVLMIDKCGEQVINNT